MLISQKPHTIEKSNYTKKVLIIIEYVVLKYTFALDYKLSNSVKFGFHNHFQCYKI